MPPFKYGSVTSKYCVTTLETIAELGIYIGGTYAMERSLEMAYVSYEGGWQMSGLRALKGARTVYGRPGGIPPRNILGFF